MEYSVARKMNEDNLALLLYSDHQDKLLGGGGVGRVSECVCVCVGTNTPTCVGIESMHTYRHIHIYSIYYVCAYIHII